MREEKETEKHNKGKKQLYTMSVVGAIILAVIVVLLTTLLLNNQKEIHDELESMTEYDHYVNEVMPVLDLVLNEADIVWRDRWSINFNKLSNVTSENTTRIREMELLGDDMIRLNTMVKALKPKNLSKETMGELKVVQKDAKEYFQKRYEAVTEGKKIMESGNGTLKEVESVLEYVEESERAKVQFVANRINLEERLQKESENN